MIRDTGMKRKIDNLGRIVIPIEIRKRLNIEKNDELSIYLDRNFIMLRKDTNTCVFCGCEENTNIKFNGNVVCVKCINKMNQLYKDL